MKTLQQLKKSDKIKDRAKYISVIRSVANQDKYIEMMKEDVVKDCISLAVDIHRGLFDWFERMGYEIPKKIVRMERTIKELKKNHKHKKYQPSIQMLVNIEKAKVELKNYKPYNKIPSRKFADRTIQQAEKKGIV